MTSTLERRSGTKDDPNTSVMSTSTERKGVLHHPVFLYVSSKVAIKTCPSLKGYVLKVMRGDLPIPNTLTQFYRSYFEDQLKDFFNVLTHAQAKKVDSEHVDDILDKLGKLAFDDVVKQKHVDRKVVKKAFKNIDLKDVTLVTYGMLHEDDKGLTYQFKEPLLKEYLMARYQFRLVLKKVQILLDDQSKEEHVTPDVTMTSVNSPSSPFDDISVGTLSKFPSLDSLGSWGEKAEVSGTIRSMPPEVKDKTASLGRRSIGGGSLARRRVIAQSLRRLQTPTRPRLSDSLFLDPNSPNKSSTLNRSSSSASRSRIQRGDSKYNTLPRAASSTPRKSQYKNESIPNSPDTEVPSPKVDTHIGGVPIIMTPETSMVSMSSEVPQIIADEVPVVKSAAGDGAIEISVPEKEFEVSVPNEFSAPDAIADGFSDSVLRSFDQESENVSSNLQDVSGELQNGLREDVDDGLKTVESEGQDLVQSAQDQGKDALQSVTGQGESVVQSLQEEGQDILNSVNEKGESLVGDLQNQGESVVGAVEEEGQKVIKSVEDEGNNLINSLLENVQEESHSVVSSFESEGQNVVNNLEDKGQDFMQSISDEHTSLKQSLNEGITDVNSNMNGNALKENFEELSGGFTGSLLGK